MTCPRYCMGSSLIIQLYSQLVMASDYIVALMLVSPPISVGRNHGQQWDYVVAAAVLSSPIIFCCCLLLCPPAAPAQVVVGVVVGRKVMPLILEHAEKPSSLFRFILLPTMMSTIHAIL